MCWVMPPASLSTTLADAERVEELGLAVVDVTHDGHDRRAYDEVGLVALVLTELEVEGLEQLAVLVLGRDDLDDVVELLTEQLERRVVDRLGRGDHLAEARTASAPATRRRRRSSRRSRSARRHGRDARSRRCPCGRARHRSSAPPSARTPGDAPAWTCVHDATDHRDARRHPGSATLAGTTATATGAAAEAGATTAGSTGTAGAPRTATGSAAAAGAPPPRAGRHRGRAHPDDRDRRAHRGHGHRRGRCRRRRGLGHHRRVGARHARAAAGGRRARRTLVVVLVALGAAPGRDGGPCPGWTRTGCCPDAGRPDGRAGRGPARVGVAASAAGASGSPARRPGRPAPARLRARSACAGPAWGGRPRSAAAHVGRHGRRRSRPVRRPSVGARGLRPAPSRQASARRGLGGCSAFSSRSP